MTKEEIKQLEERVYAIGSSLVPIDVFFNDIRDNKDPRYNKDRAYEDLKLIVDEIYRLRDKEKPVKPIQRERGKICPICFNNDIKNFVYGKYCDECGQRLEE